MTTKQAEHLKTLEIILNKEEINSDDLDVGRNILCTLDLIISDKFINGGRKRHERR